MNIWHTISVWMMMATAILAAPPTADRPLVIEGMVRLIEQVDVPSRGDGRLENLNVKEGAYVRKGEKLGLLDAAESQLQLKRTDLEYQLALEKANSDIAINAATLIKDVSRNEFQRASQAKQAAPSSISLTEFDRLRLEAAKAESELARVMEEKRFAAIAAETKSVQLQLARLAVNEREIISPLDGVVVQFHRREGEWVRLGEKVMRVVRIDRLRVEAYVDFSSVMAQLEEAPVVLEVDFPDARTQEFSGEVVFLSPEADAVNGQIRIWAEIENRDRVLRPGQRGRLKISPKKNAAADGKTVAEPINAKP